jgi:hypothetical protein
VGMGCVQREQGQVGTAQGDRVDEQCWGGGDRGRRDGGNCM